MSVTVACMDDYMFHDAGGGNYGIYICWNNSRPADDMFFVSLRDTDGKTKVVL